MLCFIFFLYWEASRAPFLDGWWRLITLSSESRSPRVKLWKEKFLKHGRFYCDPSYFEGVRIAGLLPDPPLGPSFPLDRR
jgi:hypothetical protein